MNTFDEITETTAYKVGGKLFEQKKEAERYKYEKMDPVQIGDIVSLDGGFKNIFGVFGLEGVVFDIEDSSIWFVSGLPTKYKEAPKEFIKTGGIYLNGELIEWNVMQRDRRLLSRKSYSHEKFFG